jgi:hypothetical protein
MKIKNFQFLLSNHRGTDLYDHHDYEKSAAAYKKYPYSTEKEIDKKINRWIEKNNAIVKDIKVTTYTVMQHNNGGDDAVIAIYTIMYELPDGVENTEDSKEEE